LQPAIWIAEDVEVIAGNADQLHRFLRLGDARAPDVQVALRGWGEAPVQQPRRDLAAVAGRQVDHRHLGTVSDGVHGVAAGADGLVVHVRGHDEDALLPLRGAQPRIVVHLGNSNGCPHRHQHDHP